MDNLNEIVLKLIEVLPHNLLIVLVILFFFKKVLGFDLKTFKEVCKDIRLIRILIKRDIKREQKDKEQDEKIIFIEKNISNIQSTQEQILDILTKPKEKNRI